MTKENALSKFLSEYWPAAVLTAGLLAVSFYVQTVLYWSPMVLPEEVWLKKLNGHLTIPPFNIRFFQTYATLGVHRLLGLPIRESFFSIQFMLTMLLGPCFYHYLRRLQFDRIWANIGVVLLMTAYPILGAHFAPTHTWDDLWTYLFLVLAMISLLRHRWIMAAVFLTLGALAREQIVLYYPVLLLMAWWCRRDAPRRQMLAALILPVVILGVYSYIFNEPIDGRRWECWATNFANANAINDTVASLVISFGFMWLISIAGLFMVRRSEHLIPERFLFWGAILTVPITIAVTLLFAFARETRIFFPPFVFVIPLALISLRSGWAYAKEHWPKRLIIGALVFLAAMTWIGIAAGGVLFPEFDYKANSDLRRPLAGAHLGLMAGFVLAWIGVRMLRTIGKIPRGSRSLTAQHQTSSETGYLDECTAWHGRLYRWIDREILLFEGRHGRIMCAIFAVIVLMVLAAIYVRPAIEPDSQGWLYAVLANDPFDLSSENAVAFRILTPAISYLAGLRGQLIILTNLFFAGGLLTAVWFHFRQQPYRPSDAMIAAFVFAFSQVTLITIYYGGYTDSLTYLIIFLAWLFRKKRAVVYVLLLLGLLNRESLVFILPWFAFVTYHEATDEKTWLADTIVGFILILAIYFLFRQMVGSVREVQFSLAYYLEPLLENPVHWISISGSNQLLGLFSVFKGYWIFVLVAVVSMWNKGDRKSVLSILILLTCTWLQMVFAFDSSRMLTLGFMVMIISLQHLLVVNPYRFRIWAPVLLLVNFLIPQWYTAARIVEHMQSLPAYLYDKM